MTSLKKLTAVLAVSLPLAAMAQTPAAAPAAAPAPLATIYGTLNFNLQWSQALDATGPAPTAIQSNIRSRWSVSPDSSNLGVRGTASVAHGFGVVYQCETSAFLDGIGAAGICNRNSRVGLTHAQYGTLFFGNWDTPFKALTYGTKADDPFGNTDAFGTNSILGEVGIGATGPAGAVTTPTSVVTSGFVSSGTSRIASFDIRSQNSIAYWTPKFMGLGARFQVTVNEFANARNGGQDFTGGVATLNPLLASGALNYERGPMSVGAAYEEHRDARGLRAMGLNAVDGPSKDQAWRVSAGYELGTPFGATTLGAVYEELKYTVRARQATFPAGATNASIRYYSRPALAVNAKHRLGNHELRARFNWADKGTCKFERPPTDNECNATGFAAHQVTLGYAYYLAPSTQLWAAYTKIANDQKANYSLSAGGGNTGSPLLVGNPTLTTPYTIPAGSDPEALGFGIRYAF